MGPNDFKMLVVLYSDVLPPGQEEIVSYII